MAADDRDREGSQIRNSVWKWEWGRGEEGVGAGGYILHAVRAIRLQTLEAQGFMDPWSSLIAWWPCVGAELN